jgi:hypothetical protein
MYRNRNSRSIRFPIPTVLTAATVAFGAFANVAAAKDFKLIPTPDQEAPPVKGAGSAAGTIVVGADRSTSGSVKTTNLAGTAGTKLTKVQYASFRVGNLYVNIHTLAYPDGALRAQLKP